MRPLTIYFLHSNQVFALSKSAAITAKTAKTPRNAQMYYQITVVKVVKVVFLQQKGVTPRARQVPLALTELPGFSPRG